MAVFVWFLFLLNIKNVLYNIKNNHSNYYGKVMFPLCLPIHAWFIFPVCLGYHDIVNNVSWSRNRSQNFKFNKWNVKILFYNRFKCMKYSVSSLHTLLLERVLLVDRWLHTIPFFPANVLLLLWHNRSTDMKNDVNSL